MFSTAKLQTYPARLNSAIFISFVDRFIKCSYFIIADDYLDKAYGFLFNPCVEVESQAHLGIAFSDYDDIPCSDTQHPLASLAEWPDRDAKIGRDLSL